MGGIFPIPNARIRCLNIPIVSCLFPVAVVNCPQMLGQCVSVRKCHKSILLYHEDIGASSPFFFSSPEAASGVRKRTALSGPSVSLPRLRGGPSPVFGDEQGAGRPGPAFRAGRSPYHKMNRLKGRVRPQAHLSCPPRFVPAAGRAYWFCPLFLYIPRKKGLTDRLIRGIVTLPVKRAFLSRAFLRCLTRGPLSPPAGTQGGDRRTHRSARDIVMTSLCRWIRLYGPGPAIFFAVTDPPRIRPHRRLLHFTRRCRTNGKQGRRAHQDHPAVL